MNPLLILFVVIVVLFIFVLYALVIKFVNKIFRLQKITFLQALLVFFVFFVVCAIIGGVGYLLKMPGLASILGYVMGSIVAYLLYKRYVPVSVGKFIALWIVSLILSFIVAIIVGVLIRLYIAQPFVVEGNSMAPAYPNGTYLILEEWDKSAQKGDVVIEKSSGSVYYIIARVAGVPGDVVNGNQVPAGEYYLSKDNPTATQIPGLTLVNAIIGKPILNLGQTTF